MFAASSRRLQIPPEFKSGGIPDADLEFVIRSVQLLDFFSVRKKGVSYSLLFIIRCQANRRKSKSYLPNIRFDSRIYEIKYSFQSLRFDSEYSFRNKASLINEIFA